MEVEAEREAGTDGLLTERSLSDRGRVVEGDEEGEDADDESEEESVEIFMGKRRVEDLRRCRGDCWDWVCGEGEDGAEGAGVSGEADLVLVLEIEELFCAVDDPAEGPDGEAEEAGEMRREDVVTTGSGNSET
ncbi:hypothetical protein F503_01757 [Ophiostoma piceae UAMH 11346]|uniref:Uncharacterized protein n=1 Tax=Ophiostoma piceae (strain UAMH 11346) TaxID=1262450 RepID=S3BTS4_OPHP1|nr:hypothetical protein F503_01757 [Ophiostoma piceae UAMH 11346]